MKNYLVKTIVFFLMFSQLGFAQTARKYSNEFLNIGVDAAALGMGNAVVTRVNDVTSGYWNPAGLTQIKDYQMGLMHAAWFANIAQYDYAGFAMPLNDNSAVGLTLIRFGVDDILDTTELIDSEGNIDYNNINLFSAADYALQFSYAKRSVLKDFSWGLNTKLIHRRIGKFATSFGFGLDAGFQLQRDSWHYGLMLRDITTTFNVWNINEEAFAKIQDAIPGQNQSLPETHEITIPKVQVGIGKQWELTRDIGLYSAFDLNMRFTETNDLIHSSFVSIEPALGLEADYFQMVYLRMGVNNIQHVTEFDNSQKLSFQPNIGIGFKYHGIAVDYALTNIASTGNALYSNIFSVKVDFEAFR